MQNDVISGIVYEEFEPQDGEKMNLDPQRINEAFREISEMPFSQHRSQAPLDVITQISSGVQPLYVSADSVEWEEAPEKLTDHLACRYVMRSAYFLVTQNHLFLFESGIYRKLSANEAITLLKSCFSEKVREKKSQSFWTMVYKQLLTEPQIQYREIMQNSKPEEVVFGDQVFNVLTSERRNAIPQDFFFTHNASVFPGISIPHGIATNEFVRDVTGGDLSAEELFWQASGYLLSQTSVGKSFIMFFGAVPDSGKSTWGNVLKNIVGREFCSYVAAKDLGSAYFLALLHGKKLNLSLDMDSAPLKHTGNLKMLTGGGEDDLTVNVKYGPQLQFAPREIKLLFASNFPLRLADYRDIQPIFRRLIVVPFEYSKPRNLQKTNLLQELLGEKAYIIKKSMEAYGRLLKNNFQFCYSPRSEYLKLNWQGLSDPMGAFVAQCCILANNRECHKSLLVQAFEGFIEQTGYSLNLTPNAFLQQLQLRYGLVQCRITIGNERVRGFRGICLK